MNLALQACSSSLDFEQARDLRRSVLCGELNLGRELVDDGRDAGAWVGMALAGPKPVGTARLLSGEAWVLDLLAVLPQWRRQGVASLLLEAALREARQRQNSHVLACAPAEAAPFFSARGFLPQRQAPPLTVWRLNFS